MKTISTALENHIASDATNIATCWKMTLRDSTVKAFTDHNKNLVIDGLAYQASTGFIPSAIATSDSLRVDNSNLEGVIDSDLIREEDILAGKYDFAEIEVFKVNYEDLSQDILRMSRGWIGEVSFDKNHFMAEVRGLTQRLSKTIGDLYSPSCRAKLGDGRCKVNMASFTEAGTVTSLTDNSTFTDSARTEIDGYFNFGKFTFTSGANAGVEIEVKDFTKKQFTLVLPAPYTITVGDSYSVQAGCDKTIETCIANFNNAVNFRGEPHVPGTDRMLQTSGTRTQWD